MKTILSGAILLLLASTLPLSAQNELKPAKNLVQLREIFSKRGHPAYDDRYGAGLWGGVDLNGDSIGDFAVYQSSTSQWFFYAGGAKPDTAAIWTLDSMGGKLFVGHLLDRDQHHAFIRSGYFEDIDRFRYAYDVSYLFELTDTGLSSEPIMTMDWGKQDPPMQRFISDIQMTDLNRDGFDDLLIAMSGYLAGRVPENPIRVQAYQIWVHLGGPDFSLQEPNFIVYDTIVEPINVFNWEFRVGDFDGDGYMDMLCGGAYHGAGDLLRFRWGDENSPQSWTERDFDRTIDLKHGIHGINGMTDLAIFDVNGDGRADFGSFEYEDLQGNRIYLSGEGKDVRTRSFSLEDADVFYANGRLLDHPTGHLNDSTQRFESMLFNESYLFPSPRGMWLVSGSSTGPDFDYDATYHWGNIGVFGRNSRGVRDITGDGWDDFLGGADNSGAGAASGVAIVLAGGPYIPFDDPTVSVREEPVAGMQAGLFLWPNPVVDELHIAWRGDLSTMPARFEIYDPQGRLIVEGDASDARGEMLWRCAGVPAGHYRLLVFDRRGEAIASAPVLIQR